MSDPVIVTTTGVRLLNVDDARSTRRLLADNFINCFQRGESIAHYAQRYRVTRELLESVLRWYQERPEIRVCRDGGRVTRGEGSAKVLRFIRPKKADQRRLAVLPTELNHARPEKRGDCTLCAECQSWRDDGTPLTCGHDVDEAIRRSRPCVFAGCRHSLYLEVTFAGSIRFNDPSVDPEELHPSCALDLADTELPLERIGEILNMTKERARQLEADALRKLEPLLREANG